MTSAPCLALVVSLVLPMGLAPVRAEAEVVRFGMDTRSRPWVFLPGPDNTREDLRAPPQVTEAQLEKAQGFEVELLRLLEKRLGVETRIVPASWFSLEPDLLARRFDVILSSWTPSASTPETILSSVSYCDWGLVLVVRADEARVRGLGDLEGLRVGHLRDPAVLPALRAMGGGQFVAFDDADAAFAALKAGDYDAVIYDSFYVRWLTARDRGLRAIGAPLNRLGYHAGVRREDAALLKRIDAALRDLRQSGELETLRRRWEGPAPAPEGR